jgi:hypothetical protein
VDWAIVCLRLLSSSPNGFPLVVEEVASQTTSKLTLEVSKGWNCDYDFLDEEFMGILHDCYNDHLSPYNYSFASGTDGLEWEKVYAEYSMTLLDRVEDWVSDHEGETIGPSYELYRLMKPRLQFLLRKEASHQMPLLRGLCNTPPLFCPRYYIDMGVELNGMEEIGIHVRLFFAL